jgi:hypothetical protein
LGAFWVGTILIPLEKFKVDTLQKARPPLDPLITYSNPYYS